jgi:hypothetical protein
MPGKKTHITSYMVFYENKVPPNSLVNHHCPYLQCNLVPGIPILIHIDSYCCLVSGIFSGVSRGKPYGLCQLALEQETAEKPRMDEQEFQKILLLESCVCENGICYRYVPLFSHDVDLME